MGKKYITPREPSHPMQVNGEDPLMVGVQVVIFIKWDIIIFDDTFNVTNIFNILLSQHIIDIKHHS